MRYIYRNEVDRPVNIGGYQFAAGQELPSDIILDRFNEAVSNGFLSLREVKKPDSAIPAGETAPDGEAAKAAETVKKNSKKQ